MTIGCLYQTWGSNITFVGSVALLWPIFPYAGLNCMCGATNLTYGLSYHHRLGLFFDVGHNTHYL